MMRSGAGMERWFDNHAVVMASNFGWAGNEDERWDQKKGSFVKIQRPEVVMRYNQVVHPEVVMRYNQVVGVVDKSVQDRNQVQKIDP